MENEMPTIAKKKLLILFFNISGYASYLTAWGSLIFLVAHLHLQVFPEIAQRCHIYPMKEQCVL